MICKEKKSELTMLKIIMYKVSLLTAIIPQSFSFSFSLFKLLNLKIKILLIVFFCYNPTEPVLFVVTVDTDKNDQFPKHSCI